MTSTSQTRPNLRATVREQHVEMAAFLHEIVATADCLREAKTFDGSSALRFDREWQLLAAVDRCGGAPTFADLGRALGVPRQAAREFALAAGERGVVELFPGHDGRRVWQVALTQGGRRLLASHRLPNLTWIFTLLNGLDTKPLRSAAHVLNVVRRRLEGYARDRRRTRAQRTGR
jgi:DNA-binding MarR family transcriptional regulator